MVATENMVILHIAKITEERANGVNVVVPEHIKAQGQIETVALLNIRKHRPDCIESVFFYEKGTKISDLDAPFNHPDLVVFHQVYEVEYLSLSWELRKQKIPYIVVPHGSLTVQAQQIKHLKKVVGNILFSKFFNQAVAVQCLSQNELDETRFSVKKFIGTNGIHLSTKQKMHFRKDFIKFVYIGRLDVFHKGIDILLEAFSLLKKTEQTRFELHIYGPSGNKNDEQIQQMIKVNELSSCAFLHGAVFGEEKKSILLDADVFVQTSRFEGMPMGILEALSYGIPCLITEGTTLGDYINKYNAGWVAKTDAECVYQMLLKAIEDKGLLPEKSEMARNLVEQDFSWDRIAQCTIESYQEYC